MSEEQNKYTTEKPATTESQALPEAKIKTRDDYISEGAQIIIDAQAAEDATPVGMIQKFFNANASEELKARCKTENKTAQKAYHYLAACARTLISDRRDCVSDAIGLSVAMHYFQDVPENYESIKAATKPAPKSSEAKSEAKAEKPKAEKPKKSATKKPKRGQLLQDDFFNV